VVNLSDGKCWSARAPRKRRNAAVEADVGIGDSPKERFDELVDGLARLAGEFCKSGLQRGK
jgi:hypothetical protein